MSNIVKETAKVLGLTQKELAKRMKVDEPRLSKWGTGKLDMPEWVPEMLELLKKEKKLETIVNIVSSEISK